MTELRVLYHWWEVVEAETIRVNLIDEYLLALSAICV